MAKLISDILQAPEPTFTHELQRLESLAGNPKIDLNLISEMVGQMQSLVAELGLDHEDTTAKELYFAMQKRVLEDNDRLSSKLGLTAQDPVEKVLKACVGYVQAQLKSTPVWALKANVAKAQLKSNQPKKLLKTLGLRSVDSAIKREPVPQLIVLARMVESKTWNDAFVHQANKLKNADFDRKEIEISTVDSKRLRAMQKAGHSLGHLIYTSEETAGIVVVPPQRRFSGDVLFFVDALVRGSNEIRRFSAFAKYLSVRPDFGQWLAAMRAHGFDHATTQYFSFGWAPVHQLLHNQSLSGGGELFEPHLDHDDVGLLSHRVGTTREHSYLLKNEGGVIVSCNISDVILNAANKYAPQEATSIHGRRALYSELFSRYLAHEAVMDDFLAKQP